jgi:Rap guanine nucleotide exchange factor 2
MAFNEPRLRMSERPAIFRKESTSACDFPTDGPNCVSNVLLGSDTMGSVPGSDDMDLSGLVESAVDSDEEDDLADSMDSLTVR